MQRPLQHVRFVPQPDPPIAAGIRRTQDAARDARARRGVETMGRFRPVSLPLLSSSLSALHAEKPLEAAPAGTSEQDRRFHVIGGDRA